MRFWSGSSPASHASASTQSPSNPCSGARASESSPSPSGPTTPPPASCLRPSSRAWTSSTARISLRRSREGCARPHREASGFPAMPPTATTGSWCRTVPRRDPPWRSTRICPPSSSACSTWRRPKTGRSKSSAPSTKRASPALGESSGPGTSVHNILTNEAYTGTLVWGANAKDKGEPVRVEKAFPAILTKAQFQLVGKRLSSRAPKFSPPPQSRKLLPAQRPGQV